MVKALLKKMVSKILYKILEIINSIDPKAGGFSRSLGTAHSVFVMQSGKIVMVTGYVSGATITANTETEIGRITGVDLPENIVRTVCAVSSQAYNAPTSMAYAYINTAGRLGFNSSSAGTNRAVYFTITYVAK